MKIHTGFPLAVIIGSIKSFVSTFSFSVVILLKVYDPRKYSSVYHDDLNNIYYYINYYEKYKIKYYRLLPKYLIKFRDIIFFT